MRVVVHYNDDTRYSLDCKAIQYKDGIIELSCIEGIRVVCLEDVYAFYIVHTVLDDVDLDW